MELKYKVLKKNTITSIVKDKMNISGRLFLKLKKNNKIMLNDVPVKAYSEANIGDIVSLDLDFVEDNNNIVSNENIQFNILYEDEWILIVDKPSGIPVHPSMNCYENSLSNGIKAYYESKNFHFKIRPVNRLDKNTSGIVIFAKSEYIQENLKSYLKEYIAIVDGVLEGNGKIDVPIARKNESIIERCVSDSGNKAITYYEVIKNFENFTLVKCRLETGRTHQIRVHMKYLGHPLLGDTLYGTSSKLINRQALHAYHIKFNHPVTNKEIDIYANIPEDINRIINY